MAKKRKKVILQPFSLRSLKIVTKVNKMFRSILLNPPQNHFTIKDLLSFMITVFYSFLDFLRIREKRLWRWRYFKGSGIEA